jgi:hypothetical protein
MATTPRSDEQIIADTEEAFADGWCVCISSSLPAELLDLAKRSRAEVARLEAQVADLFDGCARLEAENAALRLKAGTLEDQLRLAREDEPAAVQYRAERDSLAAVIERASRELDCGASPYVVAATLVTADPSEVLRSRDEKVLSDARVRPAFEASLINDGEFEYTVSADCDGSNARYMRRRPRFVGEYHPWELSTRDAWDTAYRRVQEGDQR